MEFIEASAFTQRIAEYLDDVEYQRLQNALAENPGLGDLLTGTGGFRKVRWADARRGKGTRGGLRIIYYHLSSDHQVWLLMVYDKDEATDLTPAQKKKLRAALDVELAKRAEKRSARKPGRKGAR